MAKHAGNGQFGRIVAAATASSPTGAAATLQRYVTVNTATAVHVNDLKGGGTPTEFEAQQPLGRDQVGTVLVQGDPLALRVSEDGRMAVEDSDLSGRQAKVFYAAPGVWQASNAALTESRYELFAERADAITVTLGANQYALDRVLPRTSAAEMKKATKALPLHKRLFGKAPKRDPSEQGLGLEVESDCINVALAIIGTHVHGDSAREVNVLGGAGASRSFGEYRATLALLAAAPGVDDDNGWPVELWRRIMAGDPSIGAALGELDWARNLNPDAMKGIAAKYAKLLEDEPETAVAVARSLRVNVHAEPSVGEAYESYSIFDPTSPPPLWEGQERTGWGQHIGAVVAESAGDRVTLENYARKHEFGDVRKGPDYYFQMYGPPSRPDQTWHHAWTAGAEKAGTAPVRNAVTVVVRK